MFFINSRHTSDNNATWQLMGSRTNSIGVTRILCIKYCKLYCCRDRLFCFECLQNAQLQGIGSLFVLAL